MVIIICQLYVDAFLEPTVDDASITNEWNVITKKLLKRGYISKQDLKS